MAPVDPKIEDEAKTEEITDTFVYRIKLGAEDRMKLEAREE